MFTRLYVEALLVNRPLADLIHALWTRGMLDDEAAAVAWLAISTSDEIQPNVPNLASDDRIGH